MKKVSLLISLMAFIFIASVSSSYAQTTDDKSKTEKTTISTSKAAPADKAPCSKAKTHKCSKAKKTSCCSKSAKSRSAHKCSGKKEDAIREEEDKDK